MGRTGTEITGTLNTQASKPLPQSRKTAVPENRRHQFRRRCRIPRKCRKWRQFTQEFHRASAATGAGEPPLVNQPVAGFQRRNPGSCSITGPSGMNDWWCSAEIDSNSLSQQVSTAAWFVPSLRRLSLSHDQKKRPSASPTQCNHLTDSQVAIAWRREVRARHAPVRQSCHKSGCSSCEAPALACQ